jgi:hypothetical protein
MGPYVAEESDRVNHGVDRPREVLTLDKVKEIMADRIEGLNVAIKDPIWVTYFNVNERIANGFRRNRAFLAGGKKEGCGHLQCTVLIISFVMCQLDAAHCHSPAGTDLEHTKVERIY